MKYKLTAILQYLTRPKITGKHTGETIVLDNSKILGAHLLNCTLVHTGGGFTMRDSHMDGCKFVLSGAAGRTAKWMKHFDGQDGPIEETFPLTIARAICEDRKG